MQKQEYKVNKSVVQNNEEKAAENASKKLGVDKSVLLSVHTEKQFVFKLPETEETPQNSNYPFGLFVIEKSEELTLQDAKHQAMEYLGTFEGNLKRVEKEEDETHYAFTKVRE
jgi:hypothetical protein